MLFYNYIIYSKFNSNFKNEQKYVYIHITRARKYMYAHRYTHIHMHMPRYVPFLLYILYISVVFSI